MDKELVNNIRQIWENAKANSPLNQKSAVSISTIDATGFPQSRFVELKQVDQSGFTFCTSYQSGKGRHLSENPKASLLAWWDHIGYQIRVVGHANRISDELADSFWLTRSSEAQVATRCFEQSEVWHSDTLMENHFCSALASSQNPISRPDYWGGYTIAPHSIEILKFKANRVHTREYYSFENALWKMQLLQP